MQYIQRDKLVHIEWSIFRGTSQVPEDFSRALVKMFLIGGNEKYLLTSTAEGGKLLADLPGDLPEGAYSLEAIWVKNYGNLLPHRQPLTPGGEPVCPRRPGPHPNDPCFIHPHDNRFNDRCLMRSRKDYVFALTDYPSEETVTGESGEVTVRLASSVATYGYDGLSAYQIAVMRGDFSGTEGEFLAQSGFTKLKTINGESLIGEGDIEITGGGKLETATETSLGGIRAAQKTQSETVEVKIDPATGKLYVPASEAEALKVATEDKLGGIKASAKTPLETQEVKIDPATGKLYTQPGGEGGVEIVNNPDEEDLHSIEKSADVHVLQFADKEYNAAAFSGLGRVYLRKNISSGKNILTQAMMSKANTRYIIQYDYDLDGETITVPEGCTLDFQGGSLGNGTLAGNSTVIQSGIRRIFSDDLSISSRNFKLDYAYPEWFGAKPNDSSFDSYDAIVKAFSMNNHVKLGKGTYYIGTPLLIDIRYKLEGEFEESKLAPTDTVESMECVLNCINSTDAVSYGFIRNICIEGSDKAKYGLKCTYITQGTVIENILIQNCTEAGLYLTKCWYAVFRNIKSWFNKHGLYLDNNQDSTRGAINGIQFESCWLNHNTGNALYHEGQYGSALSFSNCTFENSGGDAEIKVIALYNDISLYSCYIETKTKMFDLTGYGVSGNFNVFGGIFHQRNDDSMYGEFKKLSSVILMNCAWRNSGNNSTVDYLFNCTANYCFAIGSLPFSAPTFNPDANVFLFGDMNNWNQISRGTNVKSFGARSLSALSWEGKDAESTAKLQVGASLLSNVDPNFGCYRLKFVLDKENNLFRCIKSVNRSGTEEESTAFTINNWNDIKFNSRLKGLFASGYGTSRPNYANEFFGMLYYDQSIERLLIMHEGDGDDRWVDVNGFTANKIRGPHAERPSLPWEDRGAVYYSYENSAYSLWNGSSWVRIDGTPSIPNTYYPTSKAQINKSGGATYVIRSEIDLGGESLTVPEDSTLVFQGGKITNGTLTLWKTRIFPMGCNISDYITATIQSQYAEGQVLYDPDLKKMKLYDGHNWKNLDGTALE